MYNLISVTVWKRQKYSDNQCLPGVGACCDHKGQFWGAFLGLWDFSGA